jgi:hypothetical protein
MRKIRHKEAETIIRSHNALLKTVRSSVTDTELWQYIINQIADPVHNRPIKKVDENEVDRSKKWNSKTETWVTTQPNTTRGANKYTQSTKKMATTLSPPNGKIKLYEYGLGESVGLIINMEVKTVKIKPKYVFPKTINSDKKPWLKRKKTDINSYADELKEISIENLRKQQNSISDEGRIAETNEILASISAESISGVFATKDQLIYRIAAIGMQQLVMQKLNLSTPIFIHSKEKGFKVYSTKQQTEDIKTAQSLPQQSLIHQYLKFIEVNKLTFDTSISEAITEQPTHKNYLDCVKKQYFSNLGSFVKKLSLFFNAQPKEVEIMAMAKIIMQNKNPMELLQLINKTFNVDKYYSNTIKRLMQDFEVRTIVLAATSQVNSTPEKTASNTTLESILHRFYFNLVRYNQPGENLPLIEHLHAYNNSVRPNCRIKISHDVLRSAGEETVYDKMELTTVEMSALALASILNPKTITAEKTIFSADEVETALQQLDNLVRIARQRYDYRIKHNDSQIHISNWNKGIKDARSLLIDLLPMQHNYMLSSTDKDQILADISSEYAKINTIENLDSCYQQHTNTSLYTQLRHPTWSYVKSLFTQQQKSATAVKIDKIYAAYKHRIITLQKKYLDECEVIFKQMDTLEKLHSAMQEKMNEAECKTSQSTATAVMDLFSKIQTQLELSITQMIEKKQAIYIARCNDTFNIIWTEEELKQAMLKISIDSEFSDSPSTKIKVNALFEERTKIIQQTIAAEQAEYVNRCEDIFNRIDTHANLRQAMSLIQRENEFTASLTVSNQVTGLFNNRMEGFEIVAVVKPASNTPHEEMPVAYAEEVTDNKELKDEKHVQPSTNNNLHFLFQPSAPTMEAMQVDELEKTKESQVNTSKMALKNSKHSTLARKKGHVNSGKYTNAVKQSFTHIDSAFKSLPEVATDDVNDKTTNNKISAMAT